VITIVDYGVGNIASLMNMFERVGATAQLSGDPVEIARSEKLMLPGVGSFAHAMSMLRARSLDDALRAAAASGSRLLGVCLGMQLLARHSEEGDAEGLGLIAGDVVRIRPRSETVKVPNMGWREIHPTHPGWMFDGAENERFYFAHSYHMRCDDPVDVAATIDYDGEKAGAVAHGNVSGVQFHPEKSHRFGMRLIDAYSRL
jgi:glutamine amidotransferase